MPHHASTARAVSGVLGRPDATRDLLMAAALDTPSRALAAWRRWETIAGGAAADPLAQRWLPLVGWNLRHESLDVRTAAMFKEAQRAVWVSNIRLRESAQPVIDALTARGIRTLLLKGAALSLDVYGSHRLRAMGDVDILVEPEHADAAERIALELGWTPLRTRRPDDRRLVQAVDLRKPPHGALDLHWYLLRECCWPNVDRGLWRRARPLPAMPGASILSPADQLLHICVHGLRWSPVHGGYWVADAVRVLERAGNTLDWDVLVDEARRRSLHLQVHDALAVIRAHGAEVPDAAMRTLESLPVSWHERLECRLKGWPVVSAAGLFVIWAGWRRSSRAARAEGAAMPSWPRYLAAAIGVPTPAALLPRFVRHAWRGATRALGHRP